MDFTMDFTAMIYFLPEFQGGLPADSYVDKMEFYGLASFDEGDTFWLAKLDFIMLPSKSRIGVADVLLHNPDNANLEIAETFTLYEQQKLVAYCKII